MPKLGGAAEKFKTVGSPMLRPLRPKFGASAKQKPRPAGKKKNRSGQFKLAGPFKVEG